MATRKLKTTNGELVDLMNGLFSVQDLKGKGFALIVSKNMTKLQDALVEVEETGKPSEEFVKFAQDVQRLQQQKDSDAIKRLEESNKTLVNERQVQMDKVQDLLTKDAKEIELDVFTKDMLPNEITGRQVTSLEQIII
tara:strand:- start:353 stop:766 length:414 start_codon:yes stop_codon:yes gene_type:complete